MKKVRPIRIEGDVAYVPLTRGYEAVIDAADVHLVDGRYWHALVRKHTVYARCGVFIHRTIMGAPLGMEVDHINGDGLDNRRSNLRLATHAQNTRNRRRPRTNTSGFKGVHLHKSAGKWVAQITNAGKYLYLGLFETPESAYAARVAASAELHGEFGRVA